ncbi:hypothetical protein HZC31_02640 [Candidatus Woesearchaeota archaeon]|nr:hypothetical protein [Candidatus Woesearchaeota archaeon]
MTQIEQIYVEQKPEDILFQLETNLRDAREIRPAQEAAKQWKERVTNRGFSSLIAIINREMSHLLSEELTSDDFRDAEVYPGEEKMMEHELKHGLPALSFGVAIPSNAWPSIQRKFRMRETSEGISLSDYGFSAQSLGLDVTGLTMHRASEEKEYEEFQQLYEDHAAYSKSFGDLALLALEKIRSPWELSMALLCRTKRDLCAGRYEEGREKKAEALIRSLDAYGKAYEDEVRRHVDDVRRVMAYQAIYAEVVSEIVPDIYLAIEATYTLEEQIGAGIVTPLLFALGTTEVSSKRTHFRSPLKGIIKAREYIDSGEIRVEDITQVLGRKGYKQIAVA